MNMIWEPICMIKLIVLVYVKALLLGTLVLIVHHVCGNCYNEFYGGYDAGDDGGGGGARQRRRRRSACEGGG